MLIKSRIMLTNICVFGLVLAGLAWLVYDRTVEGELSTIDARLTAAASKVIIEFEDEWEEENNPEWDDIKTITVDGLDHITMTLRDSDNRIVFTTDGELKISPGAVPRLAHGLSFTETIETGHGRFRRLTTPVAIDDRAAFNLTIQTQVDDAYARLRQLTIILILSVTAALILASAAVYLVTRIAFAPLTRMVSVAETISAAHLDRRIDILGNNDEVTRLARAFNDMVARIEAAFTSQRQFVSDASHELRTPLTVVIGELEFLQKQISNEKSQRHVQTILTELDRMSHLIDQLLILARIDANRLVLEKQQVRFDELILDCIRFFRTTADHRHISFDVQMDEATEINADPIRLRSVILNLVDNAIKYSHDNGAIFISLTTPDESQVSLTIIDSGPGISAADQHRIFDRFYRGAEARSRGDGNGLGLAIAKEIVELHGGDIRAGNRPESGLEITVTLPLA